MSVIHLDYSGNTSLKIRVRLFDSTTWLGKTALAFNTSGLIISTIGDAESSPTNYTTAGSTIEDITTLGTFAQPSSTKCRFKKIDDTNMPGLYEIQFRDDRHAAITQYMDVIVSGASGLADSDTYRIWLKPVAANTRQYLNNAVPAANVSGVPIVDAKYLNGTLQTAYDLGGGVILANGAVSLAKLGTDLAWLSQPAYGTCQSGSTSNTIKLAAGASSVDDQHTGGLFLITGGTGYGQAARYCTDYDQATKVATITPPWITTPDNTTTYSFIRWGTGAATNVAGAALATQASVDDVQTDVNTAITDIAGVLAAVQNVQNNTFIGSNIPQVIERPDSGTEGIDIVVLFNDAEGSPADIDAAADPTLVIVDSSANDLSGRVSAWSHPATGKYTLTYTSSTGDDIEQIHWEITGTVNGKARRAVFTSQIVDTTAVDFTSADRTKLEAVYNKLPSKSYLAGSNNTDGDVQLDEATGALPWNAAWDAELQSEVDDALRALFLQYLFESAYNPASKPGHADALLNKIIGNDSGVPQFTANALELAPNSGGTTLTSEQWTALGTYIDFFPVATGAVVDDAENTTSYFKTNLTTINYKGMVLKFKSNVASTDNAKQARRILAHDTTTGFVTVDVAYSELPTAADTFGMAGYQSSVV